MPMLLPRRPHAMAVAGAALVCGTWGAAAAGAGSPSPAATTIDGVLPADRVIDWRESGVPGGIPIRSQVCATLRAPATRAAIQAALDGCGANEVVQLSEGRYDIDGSLVIPSNVVLRGAGPRSTVLEARGKGDAFIRFGARSIPSVADSIAITAGTGARSTLLTLKSARGIAAGAHLMVTQLNDPAYVSSTTNNGSCQWCDGGIGWNGTRVQGQIVEVVAVRGNAVTIAPGLYVDYSPARAPLATRVHMGATNAGVEDLQVHMNNTGYPANFLLEGGTRSWIRNVESSFTDGDHVQLHWGYRNEIRDSYFHDAYVHSPGSTDADLFLADKTTGTLVENNVLRRLHQSIMLNWGAAGNVIAYNFIDGNFDSTGSNTLFGGLDVHGAHPMFNLWEGNIAPKLEADYFWGSSSHNTAFRNWFKGAAMIHPPLTGGGAEQAAGGYWATQALAAVDLSQTARYYSLVGNVIGSDHQKSLPAWTPLVSSPQPRSYYTSNNAYGYSFGYANLADDGSEALDTAATRDSTIVHGDYDYVAGKFVWQAGIARHALPASLYRTTKPRWFGNLAWPAFGPAVTDPATALVGNIPAKACYDQGKMPACL